MSEPPMRVHHLLWKTGLNTRDGKDIIVSALLDDGAHLVLIREDLVEQAGLKKHYLNEPITASLASTGATLSYTHYINIVMTDLISKFSLASPFLHTIVW